MSRYEYEGKDDSKIIRYMVSDIEFKNARLVDEITITLLKHIFTNVYPRKKLVILNNLKIALFSE